MMPALSLVAELESIARALTASILEAVADEAEWIGDRPLGSKEAPLADRLLDWLAWRDDAQEWRVRVKVWEQTAGPDLGAPRVPAQPIISPGLAIVLTELDQGVFSTTLAARNLAIIADTAMHQALARKGEWGGDWADLVDAWDDAARKLALERAVADAIAGARTAAQVERQEAWRGVAMYAGPIALTDPFELLGDDQDGEALPGELGDG